MLLPFLVRQPKSYWQNLKAAQATVRLRTALMLQAQRLIRWVLHRTRDRPCQWQRQQLMSGRMMTLKRGLPPLLGLGMAPRPRETQEQRPRLRPARRVLRAQMDLTARRVAALALLGWIAAVETQIEKRDKGEKM